MKTAWIIFLVVVALSSSSRAAENGGEMWWPQFRGPNSSGLGQGKPPVHFGPSQNIQWKTAVGSGLSSPIIWAERVFLTEFDQGKLATVCIDRRTGNILWRRVVAVEKVEDVHQIGSPAGPTPATDGERVYVYFGSYGLPKAIPNRYSASVRLALACMLSTLAGSTHGQSLLLKTEG